MIENFLYFGIVGCLFIPYWVFTYPKELLDFILFRADDAIISSLIITYVASSVFIVTINVIFH